MAVEEGRGRDGCCRDLGCAKAADEGEADAGVQRESAANLSLEYVRRQHKRTCTCSGLDFFGGRGVVRRRPVSVSHTPVHLHM